VSDISILLATGFPEPAVPPMPDSCLKTWKFSLVFGRTVLFFGTGLRRAGEKGSVMALSV
jgi:hypothetical protein